jgi:hypothetical protein
MLKQRKSAGSQRPASWLFSPRKEVDASITMYFKRLRAGGLWGISTSMTLGACDAEALNEMRFAEFVPALSTAVLHRAATGPSAITGYGESYRLVHCLDAVLIAAEINSRARTAALDLFSFTVSAPSSTAEWCRRFFGNRSMQVTVALRGVHTGEMLSCLLLL